MQKECKKGEKREILGMEKIRKKKQTGLIRKFFVLFCFHLVPADR